MLLQNFPDYTRTDFNLDAPCPDSGWPNMIIHARGASVLYPEHFGPLSIKCAFGGEESYKVNRREFSVDDSGYLIVNEGSRYSSTITAERAVETFCIFFNYPFVERVLTSIVVPSDKLMDNHDLMHGGIPKFMEKPYRHDRVITPLLQEMRSHTRQIRVTDEWIEDRFNDLLIQMMRMHRDVCRTIQRLPSVRTTTRIEIYRRLEISREFIDDNLAEQISLADMARTACLSPHHFLRLFKHAFQETPHQYLTRKRLEWAQDLLTSTERSITDICVSIGFESLGSFSWLFRRRFGASPDLFRRRAITGSLGSAVYG
ncbi:MAG: transcriptional regulator, AraC family [Chlorobi bacterium]|nr:transcriptional regulator, AraC family [Chlorobiota bacterium]